MDVSLKSGVDSATRAARNAVETIGEQTHRLQEDLTARGRRSAEVVRHQVEERPITSILLAFCLGLVIGRIAR
ncbi:MAG TPA: hypothetical protein VKY65_00030 [Alphaproteobacteria bacterium]|nr:hypothetical protein [Alphaproteobacteria bacterium]